MRTSAINADTPAIKKEIAQAEFISLMAKKQKQILFIAAMAIKRIINFFILFMFLVYYFIMLINVAPTAVKIPNR